MKKIILNFLMLFSLMLVLPVFSQDNSKQNEPSQPSATLEIQENLSVNAIDCKEVNWPPVEKRTVKVPTGRHILCSSYHVTNSEEWVTTQKSVNKILVEANFEEGKKYLLQYKLNGEDVTLELKEQ